MPNKVDPRWHHEQILSYQSEWPHYERYADILESILRRACRRYAPLGIVQARPKSLASFAEKAARKADKHDDPCHQLTDLCGARVITSTSDELRAVCRFIRQAFVIDEPNSEDAGGRLKEQEFGYQSIHYIVQLHASEVLGLPVPLDVIGDRKAEIQVRTVTQHAWASITHDRLYKSAFKVPARLKRMAHRTAALLEEADEALNAFETHMQAYLGSYTAFLKPEQLQAEIDIVSVVLAAEPSAENKAAIALRLARLMHAAGDLDQLIAVLAPYEAAQGPLRLPIAVELGGALVERGTPEDVERGKSLLAAISEAAAEETPPREAMISLNDRKLVAAAFVARADAEKDQRHKSQLYTRALEFDPGDPYILCAQLAYSLVRTNQRTVVDSARPAILRAIETCRAHVAAGLQLPRPWLTMARLLLLMREDSEALDQYCKAIHFYLADRSLTWPQRAFQAEIDFLTQMQSASDLELPAIAWAQQLVRTGRWLKHDRSSPVGVAVGRQATLKRNLGGRILIIAGDTRPEFWTKSDSYFDLMSAALDGFDGVVICGGTTAGISGVVGRAAAELQKAGRKRFQLIGYHPKSIPANVQLSGDYDEQVLSGENDYLALGEPLQVWLDLLAAGIDPAGVRVLGIGGGRISRFEYAIGLTLGALVGLVESSGRSADETLRDPDWSALATLLPLPNDALTAQAFAQVGTSQLSPDELDRMARLVHENYRAGMKANYKKPNTLPWEALPDFYQESSRAQAAYMFHALTSRGYKIKRATHSVEPVSIAEDHIEPLAEVEHGRWNVERLQSGWRRASEKDDDRKLSPYLVPWKELPEQIKQYDREAVRAFPKILAAGGYQLQLSEEN